MATVLRDSWALLLGTMIILTAHGLGTSLVGVRGAFEGFDSFALGLVMAGYFVGYAVGTIWTPRLVRRVGHVRVFAAYASGASATMILFPTAVDPVLWIAIRFLNGACMAGIYVVAESWLNGMNTNRNRGQALGLYIAAQLTGIVIGQVILGYGDEKGYALFVVATVLLSIGFAPVLLSASPVPVFETTRPMSFRELYRVSPLAFVGMMLMGLIFSVIFTMAAVYGAEAGFSIGEIAVMISAIYIGGALTQYPLGWLSDRIGRRPVVVGLCAAAVAVALFAMVVGDNKTMIIWLMGLIGAATSPLYSIIGAHANDYLENDQMAACGARMIFLQGAAAAAGPPIVGLVMAIIGPPGFFLLLAIFAGALGLFAIYRSTVRSAETTEEIAGFAPLPLRTSQVAAEMYVEAVQSAVESEPEAGEQSEDSPTQT